MDEKLFSTLKDQLHQFAAMVGFQFEGAAASVDDITPPTDTWEWTNSFALLALVVVPGMESTMLADAARQASDWIGRRLTEDERRAKFIDGYLLLALPEQLLVVPEPQLPLPEPLLALAEPPSDALRSTIQKITLDTAVCRKHVLWPCDGDWTQQLWSVTALGLPTAERGEERVASMPDIPPAAKRALQFYYKFENYDEAAEMLREQVRAASRKDDSDAS